MLDVLLHVPESDLKERHDPIVPLNITDLQIQMCFPEIIGVKLDYGDLHFQCLQINH